MSKPRFEVRHQEVQDFLRSLPAEVADAIVTDPPAGWGYQDRAWDKDKRLMRSRQVVAIAEAIARARGYEGQGPEPKALEETIKQFLPPPWVYWFSSVSRDMLRVLKPGGYAVVWTAPRMAHWTGMGLELAGFEIVDVFAHLYGTGFPKNRNVAWDVDRVLGHVRKSTDEPVSPEAIEASGKGTALKPTREDWILAMKPRDGTIAQNYMTYNTGVLDVKAGRIQGDRWPGNTAIHPALTDDLRDAARYFYCPKVRTGSHETEAGLEDLALMSGAEMVRRTEGSAGMANPRAGRGRTSSGAKNSHPTVKPLALARYLVRLVAPDPRVRTGKILVPFCGSGTEAVAAHVEGHHVLACDSEEEYVEIARKRLKYWSENPPPDLAPREFGGPVPAPRQTSSKTMPYTIRVNHDLHDVLQSWPHPYSATFRAAIDHYFGIIRDPEGEVIPAGYLAGFVSKPETGHARSVVLFEDQVRLLVAAPEGPETVRQALLLWLGCWHQEIKPKPVLPRSARRGELT